MPRNTIFLFGTSIICFIFALKLLGLSEGDGADRTFSKTSKELEKLERSQAESRPVPGLRNRGTRNEDAEWDRWWARALAAKNPEDTAKFLESLSSVQSISLRQSLGANAIRVLVENGHATAAWDLIDSTYGGIRDAQIRGFFEGLAELDQRVKYFRLLNDEDDRANALGGILQKMGMRRLDELSVLSAEWTASKKQILADHLSFAFDVPGELRRDPAVKNCAEDAVRSTMKLFELGILSEKEIKTVVDTNNFLESPRMLSILDDLSKIGTADLRLSYERVIEEHVVADASGAMKAALERPNMPTLVQAAVSRYYMYDSTGAVQWFTNSSSNMTPDQFDAGALFFVNEAIRVGEMEAARAWATSLKSATLRNNIIQRIEKKEVK
jgi:hypothetical protein